MAGPAAPLRPPRPELPELIPASRLLRRSALAGIALLILANLPDPALAQTQAGAAVPTKITVRVIARGGKFLGDDVGGARISIRDVDSGEVLATGLTHGGSGPDALMTRPIARNQPLPTVDGANTAARYDITLPLDRPRLAEVSAVGPLIAPMPARVTATLWLYPGENLSAGPGTQDRALLLEIPGLLVQVVEPPLHFMAHNSDASKPFEIRANVTMMCGCPIGDTLWPAADFEVVAHIRHGGRRVDVPLHFDSTEAHGAPSQFASHSWVPGDAGIFTIAVVALQKSSGNLGVGQSSVILFKQ
jgi:hypothetical protein